MDNLKSLYVLCVLYAFSKHHNQEQILVEFMKTQTYYDEFFNYNYNRDFRLFGTSKYESRIKHAPKKETTNTKRTNQMQLFIKHNINTKKAKYNKFYCSHAYFEDIVNYQLANEDARIVNHFFFDFDKHFDATSKFKRITGEQKQAIDRLNGKALFDELDNLQEQIQDMIVYENILNDAWQEAKKVNDYFKQQGLRTYTCLSASKGVHLRCFFKPIHVNNYNRIIHDLHDNLVKQFNLKTLDPKVSGKDSNPSKSVERLPYSYNEKSGLRVIPFSFEHDSLNDVIESTLKLSAHKLVNVEDFNLSDYVNADFSDGILKLDSKIEILVQKEQDAKDKLMQEKIANGTINGTYNGNGGLFQDLRILVRFICGDANLVSEHELYDKYRCVFHNDRNPSAIVGKKNYHCLSSNCKVNKLNYFEFIRTWFGLKSDQEVKEKMVELQNLFDEKFGNLVDIGGEDVEQEMNA